MPFLIGIWIGGFAGQLVIAALLSAALRKFKAPSVEPLACLVTLAFVITVYTYNYGGADNALVRAVIAYVPTILPVYLILTSKPRKPTAA